MEVLDEDLHRLGLPHIRQPDYSAYISSSAPHQNDTTLTRKDLALLPPRQPLLRPRQPSLPQRLRPRIPPLPLQKERPRDIRLDRLHPSPHHDLPPHLQTRLRPFPLQLAPKRLSFLGEPPPLIQRVDPLAHTSVDYGATRAVQQRRRATFELDLDVLVARYPLVETGGEERRSGTESVRPGEKVAEVGGAPVGQGRAEGV